LTKYITENNYLGKNTNNRQPNTIQKTTIWAKTQTMVNNILYRKQLHCIWAKTQTLVSKILNRKRLFEQNTINGLQNTIQKATIWAKTQTMVTNILYRKWLFEQKHKQFSTKYYTENDYLNKNTKESTPQLTLLEKEIHERINTTTYTTREGNTRENQHHSLHY
jgi:hypothetical protein